MTKETNLLLDLTLSFILIRYKQETYESKLICTIPEDRQKLQLIR